MALNCREEGVEEALWKTKCNWSVAVGVCGIVFPVQKAFWNKLE